MRAARVAPVLASALAAAVAVGGCGADSPPDRTATRHAPATPTTVTKPRGAATLQGPLAFHLRRRAQLRAAPGGRRLGATIRTQTKFGSPVYLSVITRRPGWIKVRTSSERAPQGWVPAASGRLYRQPSHIVIDLSRRRLRLLIGGRTIGSYRVAIGGRSAPTPTGTFAVTDRLRVPPGTDYGCCILALNAHQKRIPQGWGGGDRVAIHATAELSAIGRPVTHGCVRATNRALRTLMRRVRLGTPVTIRP